MKKERRIESTYFEMNKRGLSTLVVTIIIISLSIVAIGLVWQIIAKIIGGSEEDASFGNIRLNMQISSVFIGDSHVSVKVSRLTGEGEIKGVKFILSDSQRSESVENLTVLDELEERTFFIVLKDLSYSELKKVSIAPIIVLPSGKERIGNILDTYDVKEENYNVPTGADSGQFCSELIPCSTDVEGSSQCNQTDGNVYTIWTVFTCVFGECSSEEVLKLEEVCSSDGCSSKDAVCLTHNSCSQNSDCGTDGPFGLPFCYNITGDVYSNYINYTCFNSYCFNEISQRRTQSCEGRGCIFNETSVECVCAPGPACITDSDCDSDGAIAGSERCVGNQVWVDWKDNFCSENNCTNTVGQVLKSGGDCSAKEGNWSCFQGECVEYVECTQDANCNLPGTCGMACVDQECVPESFINFGTVSSIWPPNMAEYFDSSSLPTSETSYVNYFAKFTSGNEGRCLRVKEHVYPTPPGLNSYLRLDTPNTALLPGDNYQIWKGKFNCDCTV